MIRAVHVNLNMAKPGKYLIVEFEGDGDREIIPDVWFQNGKCFWPPRKGQEESKKRTVIKSSWPLLPVKVISFHGNFFKYKEYCHVIILILQIRITMRLKEYSRRIVGSPTVRLLFLHFRKMDIRDIGFNQPQEMAQLFIFQILMIPKT